MDDVTVLGLFIGCAVMGVFGMLAFWSEKDDKSYFHNFWARMAVKKGDKPYVNIVLDEFKEHLARSPWVKGKVEGVKQGHATVIVDERWTPPPSYEHILIYHKTPEFTAALMPSSQVPKVSGSIGSTIRKPQDDNVWFLGSRHKEWAVRTIAFFLLLVFDFMIYMPYLQKTTWIFGRPSPFAELPPLNTFTLFFDVVGGIFAVVGTAYACYPVFIGLGDFLSDKVLHRQKKPKKLPPPPLPEPPPPPTPKEPERMIIARVLNLLSDDERQCDVARKLNLPKQRVSNIANRAIQRGYLSKSDDGDYSLTEKGRKLVEKQLGGS